MKPVGSRIVLLSKLIVRHQQEGPTHHEGNYVVSTRPVTGQWENDHCRMAAC